MTIRIRCDYCGRALKAPDRAAGKTAPCPGCGAPLTLPHPESPETPVAEPDDDAIQAPAFQEPAYSRPVPHSEETIVRRPPSRTSVGPSRPSPVRRPTLAATGPAKASRLYFLFVLAMVPLCLSLFTPSDDAWGRLERTLKSLPEGTLERAQAESDGELDEDDLFAVLPDGKIEGALLAQGSHLHWLLAAGATVVMLGGVWLLFERGAATPRQFLLVALSTSTFGILFLVMVQWMAMLTSGITIIGGGILMIFFLIAKLIAFSYTAAMDPSNGFLLSCLGFTFGVGLCEEFSKQIPVILHYRGEGTLDWKGACLWGLASGVGFGIAEGIMYAGSHYNGWATSGTYVVRFISCVSLHAVWSGAAAIMIFRRREWFDQDWHWTDMLVTMLYVLAVPMVLHGLYDTALKKEMNLVALATALASFAWLAFMIESTRSQEARFFAKAAT